MINFLKTAAVKSAYSTIECTSILGFCSDPLIAERIKKYHTLQKKIMCLFFALVVGSFCVFLHSNQLFLICFKLSFNFIF